MIDCVIMLSAWLTVRSGPAPAELPPNRRAEAYHNRERREAQESHSGTRRAAQRGRGNPFHREHVVQPRSKRR